jgi:hypothetical protein
VLINCRIYYGYAVEWPAFIPSVFKHNIIAVVEIAAVIAFDQAVA